MGNEILIEIFTWKLQPHESLHTAQCNREITFFFLFCSASGHSSLPEPQTKANEINLRVVFGKQFHNGNGVPLKLMDKQR